MQHKPFAVLQVPRGGTGGAWTSDMIGLNSSTSVTLAAATSVLGGLYVVKGIARVTTAAGTSSSLNVILNYIEADGGTVISSNVDGSTNTGAIVITPANSTTSTGIFSFDQIINVTASTSIGFRTTYASNPAATMVYNLHLVASRF